MKINFKQWRSIPPIST